MDLTEKLALTLVFLMGMFLCLSPWIDFPYKDYIFMGMGSFMLVFVFWGVFSDTIQSYKLVRE